MVLFPTRGSNLVVYVYRPTDHRLLRLWDKFLALDLYAAYSITHTLLDKPDQRCNEYLMCLRPRQIQNRFRGRKVEILQCNVSRNDIQDWEQYECLFDGPGKRVAV